MTSNPFCKNHFILYGGLLGFLLAVLGGFLAKNDCLSILINATLACLAVSLCMLFLWEALSRLKHLSRSKNTPAPTEDKEPPIPREEQKPLWDNCEEAFSRD